MRTSYVNSVKSLISKRDHLRNIAVVAHVDHGKSTLVDSLLSKAGLLRAEDAGSRRFLDSGEEQERQITMKSTGISLLFDYAVNDKEEAQQYVVNLVDTPGHVDFSSEVTAALRITDGALVVVDSVSGVSVQTETVVRQSLAERIKPILHINKVDRAIQELELTAEELYQKLNSTVESMNAVVATYQQEEALGDLTLDPRRGNVSFGSGKQGWALRLHTFARLVAARTGGDVNKIVRRLWGDHYFDPETRKFTSQPVSKSGKPLVRYACQMMLQPLISVFQKIKDEDRDELKKMCVKLGIKIRPEEWELSIKDLSNRILQRWLPAGDALSEMIIEHLPSPVVAQKYRVETLYTGPLDDETAAAIRNCDPEGPLTMFVSKMVPTDDGKRFFAFGRIFSGTLRTGQEVRVLAPNFVHGEDHDFAVRRVPRVVLMMGAHQEGMEAVSCGSTVGLTGVDTVLLKSGSITELKASHPIAPMRFSVSPVVRRSVAPANAAQLPKFLVALRRLNKAEQGLEVIINERTSEYIIAGTGELHVEVALNAFRELLGNEISITVGDPIVEFRETVTEPSAFTTLGKSGNKHNRIYITAEPLDEAVVSFLETHEVATDPKSRASALQKAGLNPNDAKKAWTVEGTNILVDRSKAVPYLPEIRDSVEVAFRQLVEASALSGETLTGVQINVMDAKVHSDAPHRSGQQITPMARDCMRAAILCARPRMVEPVFLAEVQTEAEVLGKVHGQFSSRRGYVFHEEQKVGTPLYNMRAHLPVLESFGFAADLRGATGGRAFPQLTFDHWEVIQSDPWDEKDPLGAELIKSIRKRKGMTESVPTVDDFNMKL